MLFSHVFSCFLMDLEIFDSCPSVNGLHPSKSQVLFEPTEDEMFAEPKGLRLGQLVCSNASQGSKTILLPGSSRIFQDSSIKPLGFR